MMTRPALLSLFGSLCLLSLVAGCGEARPPETSTVAQAPAASASYLEDIQPIFNNRCISCHGCLGSPCNVKLSSFAGLDRGGFPKNPYSVHFEDYPRTDMDVVSTTEAWRKRGFYPVVERGGDGSQNLAGSMLASLVSSGLQHNQPGFSRKALMPSYKHRYKHTCPSTAQDMDALLKEHPEQGMPYGLPALNEAHVDTIKAWIKAGSPGPTQQELADARKVDNPQIVAEWEAFFNAPDDRSQLVSRYIFDHVYLSSLVLEESSGDIFKLVRSKTAGLTPEEAASGQPTPPIEIIDTPHPYNNPMKAAGVDRFYYRLKKVTDRPVQKNVFVWNLSQQQISALTDLFLGPKWAQDSGFDAPWDVGNPFEMYQAIPVRSRYQFLIENSSIIVAGITQGPVCLGQAATYAVKDHFWVYFVDPDHDVSILEPQLGLGNWDALMDRSPLGNGAYEKAYEKALARHFPQGYDINAVWDGNRENPNAWLTILRHESNTWVLRGRQGGIPRSQWMMGYSGFERIYYDSVAHFKYYGGDAGKLATLGFFNFLRQEFEDLFLLLLPEKDRTALRQKWTQGIGEIGLWLSPFPGRTLPSQVKQNDPDHPILSVVADIQAHLGPVISGPPDQLNPWAKPDFEPKKPVTSYDDWAQAISSLTVTDRYRFPRYLPSMILLKLNDGQESRLYSLVVNRVYETQYTLLFQNGESLPDLYTLSVYPSVVGGFPNLFMEIDLDQVNGFITELRNVQSLPDFLEFRDRYAVLRNQAQFWGLYDWFNDWNFKTQGPEAGVFDLSYYDLFDSVY